MPQALNVLWIDDERDVLEYSTAYLARHGIQVRRATDGGSGLAAAVAERFDLIVLDIRLPDISGTEVLRLLRHNQVRSPVLVLTGFATVDSAGEAIRLGANDYRSKPLIGAELRAAILSVAEGGAATRRDAASMSDAEWFQNSLLWLDELGEGKTPNPTRWLMDVGPRVYSALTMRDVGVPIIFGCALLLDIGAVSQDETLDVKIDSARRKIGRLARFYNPGSLRREVTATIAWLEAAGKGCLHIHESQVADAVQLDPAHVGRLVLQCTGLTFRQWRWGVLLRPALRPLLQTNEQIAQIAYQVGYADPTRFDRDFRRVFGMTPRALRMSIRTFELHEG